MQNLEDNTLFMFVPTNVDDDSRIKNSSCAKIQHCKTSKIVDFECFRTVFKYEGRLYL